MTGHRPESGSEHPHSDEGERTGGSGTTAPDSPVKRQAGSYGRDAEQDPDEAPPSETD